MIPTFSPDLTNARAETPYPHIEVHDKSESLALMLSSLEKGDLPVVFSRESDRVQIASVRTSAVVLATLARVTHLTLYLSPDDFREISDTDSIMEALAAMKGM